MNPVLHTKEEIEKYIESLDQLMEAPICDEQRKEFEETKAQMQNYILEK